MYDPSLTDTDPMGGHRVRGISEGGERVRKQCAHLREIYNHLQIFSGGREEEQKKLARARKSFKKLVQDDIKINGVPFTEDAILADLYACFGAPADDGEEHCRPAAAPPKALQPAVQMAKGSLCLP